MFKILILQRLYNLSDRQTEFQRNTSEENGKMYSLIDKKIIKKV
ncbi:MAG: transposase [Leptospiraceae bacterium]|nr:transposase [Leptospiraceae bacterium]MCP5510784.1 transposase [Leptospiraceae bacterium]